MTNMTEAKLAREAEISYATLAAVTDYDCWHEGHDSVTLEMILDYLSKNIENARNILKIAIPLVGALSSFSAKGVLATSIVTDSKVLTEEIKTKLKILIGDYIK